MKLLLALTLGLTTPSPPELRGFLDAAQLEAYCLAPAGEPDGRLGLCLGYIAGSVDQLLMVPPPLGVDALCTPPRLTVEQLRLDFLAHLKAHPRQRETAAALVVKQAAWTAYPCEIGEIYNNIR